MSAPVLTLAREEHGAGGRSLVLVHGLTGSRDDWADVLPALAGLGRTVVYDQRGHGASPRASSYCLDDLVRDLAELLDDLGRGPFDLLGHSLGGGVVLRYALAHPERVASLILMSTASRPPVGIREQLTAAAAAVAAAGSMEPLAGPLATLPFWGEDALVEAQLPPGEHRRRLVSQLLAVDPGAFAALVPELVDHEPVTHRLPEVRCPTTVLVGGEDEPFRQPALELAAGIAGARLVVIPGAAHSPQKSARDAWLSAVMTHLRAARAS